MSELPVKIAFAGMALGIALGALSAYFFPWGS